MASAQLWDLGAGARKTGRAAYLGKIMITRLGFFAVLAFGWAASVGPASSSGLEAQPAVDTAEQVQLASFFGRPYPYGYTGWGPCIRYIQVETADGPRLRRVRACGPILRSAG